MTAHLRVATCQVLKAIRNKWLPCWTADLEYIKQSKKKEEEEEEKTNNQKNVCGIVTPPDCNGSIGIWRDN